MYLDLTIQVTESNRIRRREREYVKREKELLNARKKDKIMDEEKERGRERIVGHTGKVNSTHTLTLPLGIILQGIFLIAQ